MRLSRQAKKLVGLLMALGLVITASSCSGSDDQEVTTTIDCPSQAVVDDLVDNATELREEAEGMEGGQGKEAREKASDAEEVAEAAEARLDSDECQPDPDETTTTEAPTTTTSEPETSGDVSVEVDTASLAEVFEGPVAAEELAFGPDAEAVMVEAPQERGAAAHSAETLRTPEELTSWLKGSDPKAKPVLDRVTLAIAAECGAEDLSVHLDDSQGWLLMVVKPGSQILGTSYMVDGNMEFADSWRQVGENDAYWLPVCTQGANEGKIVPNGMVRADCGNGHDTPKIRINRPGTPKAPPVEAPPAPECPPETPHGGWDGEKWVCKNDPAGITTEQTGNNHPDGGGVEEGGSEEGGPRDPASRPPDDYTPPAPPAATPVPETRPPRPGSTTTTAPPAPVTTVPDDSETEVTAPPVTELPPLEGF